MQTVWINTGRMAEELNLPAESDELLEGVRWGAVGEFFTPAFWKCQAELHIRRGEYTSHRLGSDLREEVAVCLLGGYGIPAEIGLLAFERLKSLGMFAANPSESEIREHLARPFVVRNKQRRYRFHTQKATYLHCALNAVDAIDTECADVELRERLMALPGIGPKTASWIVRNHRGSNAVAIVDIHLLRAGRLMGLFPDDWEPARNYFELESRFLKFCSAVGVQASILDALIWDYMRRAGPTVAIRPTSGRAQDIQLSLAV